MPGLKASIWLVNFCFYRTSRTPSPTSEKCRRHKTEHEGNSRSQAWSIKIRKFSLISFDSEIKREPLPWRQCAVRWTHVNWCRVIVVNVRQWLTLVTHRKTICLWPVWFSRFQDLVILYRRCRVQSRVVMPDHPCRDRVSYIDHFGGRLLARAIYYGQHVGQSLMMRRFSWECVNWSRWRKQEMILIQKWF